MPDVPDVPDVLPFSPRPAPLRWFPPSQKASEGFSQLLASEPWKSLGRTVTLTLGQIGSPNLCRWGRAEISSHEFNLKWLWVVVLLGTWLRKPPSPLVPENSAEDSLRAAGSTQSELTSPHGAEASRGGRDSRERPSRPRALSLSGLGYKAIALLHVQKWKTRQT